MPQGFLDFSRAGAAAPARAGSAVPAPLPLPLPVVVEVPAAPTIAERFQQFLAGRGGEIYALFRQYAFEARRRGRRRFSGKAIVEVIRWNTYTDHSGEDPWKINDHMTRCMVRKLVAEHPELAPMFETRAIKTE